MWGCCLVPLSSAAAAAAAGPTCVPPKWARLICTQSFFVRFFKAQSALPIPFCFCCQTVFFFFKILNYKNFKLANFFSFLTNNVFWKYLVRALVISVCWLLIQKMSPVINKGPWVSYSQVTCLGLKLVKNPTQTLLIWCFLFYFFVLLLVLFGL